jgi:signal transduction histidine kinase
MLALARADADGYQPTRLVLPRRTDHRMQPDSWRRARARNALSLPSPSEIPFTGDEELLQRMLMNVLLNAVRYSPWRNRCPPGSSGRFGLTIRVKIRPGIPEAIASAFDRFVRGIPRAAMGPGSDCRLRDGWRSLTAEA